MVLSRYGLMYTQRCELEMSDKIEYGQGDGFYGVKMGQLDQL